MAAANPANTSDHLVVVSGRETAFVHVPEEGPVETCWVRIQALLLSSSVSLGELPAVSGPQFPLLEHENDYSFTSQCYGMGKSSSMWSFE